MRPEDLELGVTEKDEDDYLEDDEDNSTELPERLQVPHIGQEVVIGRIVICELT